MNDHNIVNENVKKYKTLSTQVLGLESDLQELYKARAIVVLQTIPHIERPSTRRVGGVFGISHQLVSTYIKKFGKEVLPK